MVVAMHHRGPDGTGLFWDEVGALGHARLAILDTSTGGHQPMVSADGLIQLVLNGEIYNYESERDLLIAKGYSFQTSSDTEVVLRLYEEYGDKYIGRLREFSAPDYDLPIEEIDYRSWYVEAGLTDIDVYPGHNGLEGRGTCT
tara:strand:- start:155406 stop:155834 length:429 start_codon:yes stop_codon:yes gene_type:complete